VKSGLREFCSLPVAPFAAKTRPCCEFLRAGERRKA
jgi:hypothetical protein